MCHDRPMIPIWRDPTVSGIGRLPMHGLPHPDRFPLDGRWDFQLLPTPDAEPAPDGWREIDVPGLWTRQGTTDLPHYTNVQMPWPHRPPDLPDENPTGWYRRTFVVPTGWRDRRVVLHVGAAESVLLVTLNGRDVGASKDSHLAAEFDVTGSPRPGRQRAPPARREVVRRVLRRGPGPVVARRDQPLRCTCTPRTPVHLADVRANAGLDADGTTGTLRFTRTGRRSPDERPSPAGRSRSACRAWVEAATADAVVTPVPHDHEHERTGTAAAGPCGIGRFAHRRRARGRAPRVAPAARPGRRWRGGHRPAPCPASGRGRARTRTSSRSRWSCTRRTAPSSSGRPCRSAFAGWRSSGATC